VHINPQQSTNIISGGFETAAQIS